MLRLLKNCVVVPIRFHFWGSFAIVLGVAWVLAARITDRRGFADGELHRDVMERWGAPISQPMPSVRYVPTGTVFNTLAPLPLSRQTIVVDATMSYRKRGLVYFSGFDFTFAGDFDVANTVGREIDVALVFPIGLEKNKVLLSDLSFTVDGVAAPVALGPEGDQLVWTGHLTPEQTLSFHVGFRGRGLDSFLYRMDPTAPARNVSLTVNIAGGDGFDYADGVVPATTSRVDGDRAELRWQFGSLESGIPIGVVLPSEKSFDAIIATMVGRSWAPFLLFFAGLTALGLYHQRRLRIFESYLFAAAFALFFVLTAYFAAFMHFYLAFALALALVTALLGGYARLLLPAGAARPMLGLVTATLLTPSLAVILQGYTGLLYTLETLALIATLMVITARQASEPVLAGLGLTPSTQGANHVA